MNVPSLTLTRPTVRFSTSPKLNLNKVLPALPTYSNEMTTSKLRTTSMGAHKSGSKSNLNKALPSLPRKAVSASITTHELETASIVRLKPDLNKPLPSAPTVARKPVSGPVPVYELAAIGAESEPQAETLPELESTPLSSPSSKRSSYNPSLSDCCKEVFLSYWNAEHRQFRDRLTWIFDCPVLTYKSPRYMYWTEELQLTSLKNGGLTQDEAALISDVAKAAGQRIYVPLINGENVWVPNPRSERQPKVVPRPCTPGSDFHLFDDSKIATTGSCDELFTFFDDSGSEAIEASPVASVEPDSPFAYSFHVGDSLRFSATKLVSGPSESASSKTSSLPRSKPSIAYSFEANDESKFQIKRPIGFSQRKKASRTMLPPAVNMQAIHSYDEQVPASKFSIAVRGYQVHRRPVGEPCIVL